MKYHTTISGDEILLKDMDDNHLQNMINYIKRKAKNGLLMQYGGGHCADDMWYDEETIYGKEVLKELGYKHYIKEQKKRVK